jgi:hypothetical protein
LVFGQKFGNKFDYDFWPHHWFIAKNIKEKEKIQGERRDKEKGQREETRRRDKGETKKRQRRDKEETKKRQSEETK